MKRNKITLICSAMLMCLLNSCLFEEKNIFDESAAERLNKISGDYTTKLTSVENGWALQLYPSFSDEKLFGEGYLLLCNFHKDGSVDVAMKNTFSYNTFRNCLSAWQVIVDNGPVLSFNTHNDNVHAFSDPNDLFQTPDRYDDESGRGMGGDYEFIMVDVPDDLSHIMLKGKKRGTYNYMTPIPSGMSYQDYIDKVEALRKSFFPVDALNDVVMEMEGGNLCVAKMKEGIATVYPEGTDSVMTGVKMPYLITISKDGRGVLRFRDILKNNAGTTTQELVLDESTQLFYDASGTARLVGVDPLDFFHGSILTTTGGEIHNVSAQGTTPASQRSADFDAIVSAVAQSFKTKKIAFNSFAFVKGKEDGIINLRIVYNQKSYANYVFTASFNDGKFTLNYQEPLDVPSGNILNTITELNGLLSALSRSFTVSGIQNPYLLNNLKLAATDNANIWFEVYRR